MIVDYPTPFDSLYYLGPMIPEIFVQDLREKAHSSILDGDGRPIRYESQSQGFIGFVRLGAQNGKYK